MGTVFCIRFDPQGLIEGESGRSQNDERRRLCKPLFVQDG